MKAKKSFRIGKVRGDLRGKNWYLTYHEFGKRHRPRVGPDKEAARQLAAQTNSQLELGTPSALSYEPIDLCELQQRWLNHHEQVLRSSLQTIKRYRAATNHLIRFVETRRCPQKTSLFLVHHAEDFVVHLRSIQVSSNGHPNTKKRPLMDKGLKYLLECCRSMFNFASKRRHLSPYADNPFSSFDLDRIPIENSKPTVLFSADQEREFLDLCDPWQLPIFLTLIMTGIRPGELTHLLLPEDLDFTQKLLRINNKPELDWQVKTRNEREIPLVGPLSDLLQQTVGSSLEGLVFRKRLHRKIDSQRLASAPAMKREIQKRISLSATDDGDAMTRETRNRIARQVWSEAGMIRTDRIRKEFLRITRRMGLSEMTAPKMLRHLFATTLQEGDVDPLIRCELMGHSTSSSHRAPHGLGMTANYTQTRAETKRRQLERALKDRPAWQKAVDYIKDV